MRVAKQRHHGPAPAPPGSADILSGRARSVLSPPSVSRVPTSVGGALRADLVRLLPAWPDEDVRAPRGAP
jgi:hypothetical protein